jgi:hypothetical protein
VTTARDLAADVEPEVGKAKRIMWSPCSEPGLEDLLLRDEAAPSADGIVLGIAEGLPFRLRYVIRCDERWRVRSLRVEGSARRRAAFELHSDGEGTWRDASGTIIEQLSGCIDVDISATPFTNTLPIRRLRLRAGETSEIRAVYVDVPAFEVTAERQRYTCLEAQPNGRYRYQSVPDGTPYELAVDADGIVLDYPGLFRRIWPR